MSEITRLGVDIEPLSSFDGVQMTVPEFDAFREISSPAEFIDGMVKTDQYFAMNDRQRKTMLDLAVDHFQTQAEDQVNTHAGFSDLRHRIRSRASVPQIETTDEVTDQ